MKKYPHGLTLNAVCAAIDDYQRHEDSVPEEGILAAFSTLLGHSDIADALRSMERTVDANMAAAQAMHDDMYHWKQRAEAAEALNNHLELAVKKAEGVSEALRRKVEAAEAKLAERGKQEPTGLLAINTGGGWRIAGEAEYIYASEHGFAASELFTRPAPAADLSELVPDEITHADAPELQEIASSARAIGIKGTYAGFAVGANWMRAAILRNIEEAV